jgi:ABC-type multidrug transport system fused ATPase/permease subunit
MRMTKTIPEQKKGSGMRTLRKVLPYLWPSEKGYAWVKWRVVIALGFLIFSKVISVATPFFYKGAVDAMAPGATIEPVFFLLAGAVGLTIAYGVARLMNVGFQQLRVSVNVLCGV